MVNRLRVVPDVERKDSEIRHDVVDQILRYAWYTVYDSIDAGVADGVVILCGPVNQPYRKTDIESRVARIPGVKGLKSEIRVQGVSSFDDDLAASSCAASTATSDSSSTRAGPSRRSASSWTGAASSSRGLSPAPWSSSCSGTSRAGRSPLPSTTR